jgi:hypothetical protein
MARSVQGLDLDLLSNIEDGVVARCFGNHYRVFSCNDRYVVVLELPVPSAAMHPSQASSRAYKLLVSTCMIAVMVCVDD